MALMDSIKIGGGAGPFTGTVDEWKQANTKPGYNVVDYGNNATGIGAVAPAGEPEFNPYAAAASRNPNIRAMLDAFLGSEPGRAWLGSSNGRAWAEAARGMNIAIPDVQGGATGPTGPGPGATGGTGPGSGATGATAPSQPPPPPPPPPPSQGGTSAPTTPINPGVVPGITFNPITRPAGPSPFQARPSPGGLRPDIPAFDAWARVPDVVLPPTFTPGGQHGFAGGNTGNTGNTGIVEGAISGVGGAQRFTVSPDGQWVIDTQTGQRTRNGMLPNFTG